MVDEKRLYAALGERLKQLRAGAHGPKGKLTQSALANEVGLERTSITNIEQGNQKVPLHVLYRICEVLEVSISDVLPLLEDVQPGGGVQGVERDVGSQGRSVVTSQVVASSMESH
ncbi:helix-turn-helix transcriptional regulator [Paraburkholderia aspalathi]|uniref:DNA-binding transcriptional regulator, XRE-family HTH domain n=1 Tax=Paraburkholderia aspalathi TaxID=1324617 RepID=A0A1I7CM13_9BURK|nr:helix-turn-helix transcriptional regulator [Paraburkholderia aspalathi]SFU00462.1 DNA-binding transcriptional regulator, XRE-family HTH domain [Paraburkholderia aspalathi]